MSRRMTSLNALARTSNVARDAEAAHPTAQQQALRTVREEPQG